MRGILPPRVRSDCWIGDWWAFGEHQYGERKALVESEEWTGPAFQTCAHAAAVCRKFETCRRRQVVGFFHHAEVAALPPEEADRLLNWCQESLLQRKMRSLRGANTRDVIPACDRVPGAGGEVRDGFGDAEAWVLFPRGIEFFLGKLAELSMSVNEAAIVGFHSSAMRCAFSVSRRIAARISRSSSALMVFTALTVACSFIGNVTRLPSHKRSSLR